MKRVKRLSQSSGYISMPLKEFGKEFIVLSPSEFELLLGRKFSIEDEGIIKNE